jgi:hypothetical protein
MVFLVGGESTMKPITTSGLFFLVAASFPACAIFDVVTGGCEETGTIGAEGRVRFRFMQSGEDLSSSSGNAFAAGSKASVAIEAAGGEEPLPSWSVRSSDEEILTAEEADRDEDYPVTLSMRKQGEAKVEVVGLETGGMIDTVALKVLAPDGLQVRVSHPVLGGATVDATIALASGGPGCVLDLLPFKKDGASQKVLFGEFEAVCDVGGQALILVPAPITADHPCASVTVGSGMPGSYDLALRGPGDSTAEIEVLAVSPTQVDSFDLVFTPMSGDGKHAGDWGYLTGLQVASGTALCSGHPVVFATDSPAIVTLDRVGVPAASEDTVRFVLQTSGVAGIAAALQANPALKRSIELVVQPVPTY